MTQRGSKSRAKGRHHVVLATKDDLSVILGWLKREYREDGEGFWSNRSVVVRSLEEGSLWVIRAYDDAVAFQVGDYGIDIVCVRKDLRRQGHGTALFKFSLDRAFEDDVNVLRGECSPRNSLSFWQKMGFEQYGDCSFGAPIFVRRVLHRKHDLSSMLPKIEVGISFFPEAALYGPGVSPIAVHKLMGGQIEGRVRLPYRVVGFPEDAPSGDLVVKIAADENVLCFCKAKHGEAETAGIKQDRRGNSFYVDEIVVGH